MKNIIYILFIFLSFQFYSCSEDYLDTTQYGAPSSENFWIDDAAAILGTNSIYSELDAEEMYGRGYMWLINASDDMIDGRNKSSIGALKNFTSDGNVSYLNDSWSRHWKTIRLCNDVIRNIKEMDEEGLISEDVRDFCLGQAYFMSGWMYFELSYHYGDSKMGIPILSEEDPTDYMKAREENVQVNYDYAMEKLQLAYELLPSLEDMDSEDKGRPHKDAALAVMAKISLYTEDWQSVIDYADLIANSSSGRALIDTDTPSEDFHSVFKIENNLSSEYLWSVVSNENRGSMLPGVMLENKGWGYYNGWGYFQPTKDLDDEFEDGDYRRKATLITDGDTIENFFGDDFVWYQTSNNLTGFMFSKYLEPYQYDEPIGNTINTSGDYVTTDLWVPLIRYADIILMKAEAKIMLNGAGSGDEEINMIRDRAGLAAKSDCTLEDLKHERRCELAGEFADRHFDLVRWEDAEANYAQPLSGMRYNYDASMNLISSEETVVWEARDYNPEYHHVWPIPPEEIEKTEGTDYELVQNAGW